MLRDIVIAVTAFAVATGLAALLGAANLGTAATFGQVAFVVTAGWLMVRG